MFTVNTILCCCLLILASAAILTAQNLKADEIVAKHLDAIGSAEKRAGLSTIMALGFSEFEANMPVVKGGGKAIIVSNPENLFFVISLNSREYPFEKIGYFNGKSSLPFINAGSRSLLGIFINEHGKLLTEGLFGGSMTLRWPLGNAEKVKSSAKAAGSKKIADRKVYTVDYNTAAGSSEFSIKLYFDAETFQHVRSEYRRETTPRNMVFGQQNQQTGALIVLTEDFSDYRNVDGLSLPFGYKVTFMSNSNTTTNMNVWKVNVAEYRLNQKLSPDFFTFESQ